jgi:hypothetical protein
MHDDPSVIDRTFSRAKSETKALLRERTGQDFQAAHVAPNVKAARAQSAIASRFRIDPSLHAG